MASILCICWPFLNFKVVEFGLKIQPEIVTKILEVDAFQDKFLNFAEYKLSFQADQLLHCTQPWSGRRLVLAAFCVSRFANTATMRQLVDLGFVPPLATGGLSSSAPVQPSRPLILELFAGTGRVSAALKIMGYEAVAVDHAKHPRAAHRIQIADLTTPEGVS